MDFHVLGNLPPPELFKIKQLFLARGGTKGCGQVGPWVSGLLIPKDKGRPDFYLKHVYHLHLHSQHGIVLRILVLLRT